MQPKLPASNADCLQKELGDVQLHVSTGNTPVIRCTVAIYKANTCLWMNNLPLLTFPQPSFTENVWVFLDMLIRLSWQNSPSNMTFKQENIYKYI